MDFNIDKEIEEEEREELRRSKLTKAEIEVEDEAKYRADQEKEENLLRWDRELSLIHISEPTRPY